MFRVLGDTLEIWPSSSEEVVTFEFFDTELERISQHTPMTYEMRGEVKDVTIYPAKHFVTSKSVIDAVIPEITREMEERIAFFHEQGKLLEAERIKLRVEYDLEMLSEVGFVNGIENYSMYLSGRKLGDTPSTLLEFFPRDALTFIDESHISIPQIGGMYAGDRARKMNLVDYGFRLPSALENRPLQFNEFEKKIGQTIFISATPSKYEEEHEKVRAHQVIRPTGLIDPVITIEDMECMVDSLMREITATNAR
jgi:excinuclease ABC subunit B